jgi:alkylation response protein AidB-like acyl-CoA dehydrogenase
MYNLRLSPEQLAIRATVRDFVTRELKPAALKPGRLEAQSPALLLDCLDEASQLGLRALALSENAGGAGADTLTCCIVMEELAAGDPDIAAVLGETWTLAHALFDRLMSPAQRQRFLPAFLDDTRYHLARAAEEPDRDTSLGINYHRAERTDARFLTTAVRSSDCWVLNGSKQRVVNAALANLFAVEVTAVLASGRQGTSTILVPRDAPGLTVETDSRGMQHGACGRISLRDCRVPAENLVGVEADSKLAEEMDRRLPQELALHLGIGRAAYEAALDYAQLRVQGGRRIIEHQAIGAKLADVAVRLEAARSTVWQAAWACDHPDVFADGSLPDLPLARMAKVFASQAIYHAAKDAAECFGAMGVMRDMPLQKYVHDALISLHSGESNTDARLRIAEAIAGFQRVAAALASE